MRNKNSKEHRIVLWSGLFLMSMVLLIGPGEEPLFVYAENRGTSGTEYEAATSERIAVVQESEEEPKDPEESEELEEPEVPKEDEDPDESGESEEDPEDPDGPDGPDGPKEPGESEEDSEEENEAPKNPLQDDNEEESPAPEESSNEEDSNEEDLWEEEASNPDLEEDAISEEVDFDTENEHLIRIPIEYNNQQYYVWSIINGLDLPDKFYLQKIAYEDNIIEVAYEERKKLILVYLQQEEGSGDFYIYQPSRNLFYPYIQHQQPASFIPTMLREEGPPRGYTRTMLQLEGEAIAAWQHPNEALRDFYVLHGEMAGEEGFYLYDQEEKTLQRFISKTKTETTIIQEQRAETKSAGTTFGAMTSDRRIMGLVLSLMIMIFSLIIPIVYFYRSKKSIINVRYNDE